MTMLRRYADLVLALSPVSFYAMNTAASTVVDTQGVQNGALNSGMLQDGMPPIVQDNDDGGSVGFYTLGASAQIVIPNNAAHKTAGGGVAVAIQPKPTGGKRTLVASDASSSAGGWSLELEANGQLRAYLREAGNTPVILTSSTGAIVDGDAVCVAFTWGAAGLKLYIDGSSVDTDAETDGANTGSLSETTVGMWHTGGLTPYYGLMSKLVLFASQPSDGDVASIALPLDAAITTDNSFGDALASAATDFDALADDHYQGAKTAATIAFTVQGTFGTWSALGSGDLRYTAGATPGADTAGRYTVNGEGPGALSVTVIAAPPSAGDNDHDALVMAAPGQISDVDLQAADVYYWSAEMTDAIRDEWNGKIEPSRWNFSTPQGNSSTNINSKTKLFARNLLHQVVIEPSSEFADEVLVAPSLSQDGVLRFTTRNKAGWDFNHKAVRNYRKHALNLRLSSAHPAYIIGSTHDHLLFNQTYEVGFTFWQGGTNKAFYQDGACALFQVHGEQPCIYFQVDTTGSFSGFTRPNPSSKTVSFSSFPMTTGYTDIHVLKFSFRLAAAAAGGHFKVWYNDVVKLDLSCTLSPGTNPFNDMMFTYRPPWPEDSSGSQSPSLAGGSTKEPTIYGDRAWRRAL